MTDDDSSANEAPQPTLESLVGSSYVDLSSVTEKGMVIDSAAPIIPVAAADAPTAIAQPPAAPVMSSDASSAPTQQSSE